jgi:hypothetical protein
VKGTTTLQKAPIFPSDLFSHLPINQDYNSEKFQLKIFLLLIACFFGWRANSVFNLMPSAIVFHQLHPNPDI